MAWTLFLFITTMNPLLEVEGRSAEVTSDDSTRHPACREFMDDVIMMTSSIQLMNLTKNTFSIQKVRDSNPRTRDPMFWEEL